MKYYDVYVKTSAIGQAGIHWRHIISAEEQPRESPGLVNTPLFKYKNGYDVYVNDLLNEVHPSILIFRNQDNLMLEIAGIEAPSRSERMGRKVLNLIALIFKNDDQGEQTLRKIAYDALQYILGKSKKLDHLIEDAIRFYEKDEFRFNFNILEKYINELDQVDNQECNNKQQIIEKKTNHCLEELAETIRQYSLPSYWISRDYTKNEEVKKDNGILLVVTNSLEHEDIFFYAGVWRAFATNVKEPEIIQPKPDNESQVKYQEVNHSQQLDSREVYNSPKKLLGILVAILGVILVISIITIMLIIKLKPEMVVPNSNPFLQENSQKMNSL